MSDNMDNIYIDLNFLTESERHILEAVIAKDDDFRRQEKKRLGELKKELNSAKQSGARAEPVNSKASVCARCHKNFGMVFNRGAICPKCRAQVCKMCRMTVRNSWLCILCGKVRDVRAKSGAWFYEQVKTKSEARSLVGTSLLRASLKRKITSSNDEFEEPPAPPVIGLNPTHNGSIHRPIPVHMSAIQEKLPNDLHAKDKSDERETDEVNQNYKTYTKAVPVTKGNLGDSNHSDKEEESQDESTSGHSTPTPEAINVTSPSHQHEFQNGNESEEEPPVFDFLNENQPQYDQEHVQEDAEYRSYPDTDTYEQQHENSGDFKSIESASYDSRGYQDNEYTSDSDQFYSLPANTGQPTAHVEESTTGDSKEKYHLAATPGSMESFKTDDYLTATETSSQSDFNTATQSLTSDNELDFVDARDTTPIPVSNSYERYTLEETYTDGTSMDVVPPQIVTTAVDDDDVDGQRLEDNDEANEDIDQAFAEYGVDLSSKRLSERFDMGSRESIVSYYSEAGDGHYGNILVTGEVQVGLKYDFRAERLEIQVHRARDIAPVDTKRNRSDPYVKIYLLPDKTKGGKRKTRTKKNTLNPKYDEILTFKVSFEEMLTRSLWLCVWNHDRFGHNDFLGELILSMETYDQSGFSWEDPSEQWYPLQERRPEPSLMTYCGELIISLKYVPSEATKSKKWKKKTEGGDLYINMKGANNLPPKDANGFSDPFCKAYLLPDKSRKTKRKTPTVKKNLNPAWNHCIVYNHLTMEDLLDRVLELTVWDRDRGSSNDFLGGVRLGIGAKKEMWDDAEGDEIAAWQRMLDNPHQWNDCTLTLRSSMDSRS